MKSVDDGKGNIPIVGNKKGPINIPLIPPGAEKELAKETKETSAVKGQSGDKYIPSVASQVASALTGNPIVQAVQVVAGNVFKELKDKEVKKDDLESGKGVSKKDILGMIKEFFPKV